MERVLLISNSSFGNRSFFNETIRSRFPNLNCVEFYTQVYNRLHFIMKEKTFEYNYKLIEIDKIEIFKIVDSVLVFAEVLDSNLKSIMKKANLEGVKLSIVQVEKFDLNLHFDEALRIDPLKIKSKKDKNYVKSLLEDKMKLAINNSLWQIASQFRNKIQLLN